MKYKKFECYHKETEFHKHRRKNFPFGKNGGSRQTSVKRVTDHCKKCNVILDEWKVR